MQPFCPFLLGFAAVVVDLLEGHRRSSPGLPGEPCAFSPSECRAPQEHFALLYFWWGCLALGKSPVHLGGNTSLLCSVPALGTYPWALGGHRGSDLMGQCRLVLWLGSFVILLCQARPQATIELSLQSWLISPYPFPCGFLLYSFCLRENSYSSLSPIKGSLFSGNLFQKNLGLFTSLTCRWILCNFNFVAYWASSGG